MNFYENTLPIFKRMLKNLDAILVKASAWAADKRIADETVLNARLALDMFPLKKQVQVCCDNAKNSAFRLSGKEVVKLEDNESTFEELRARIHKTLELLNTFSESDFEGVAERTVVMPYHGNRLLDAENYVTEYALPNFFFHMTTAYDILRSAGMDIGKADFLGQLSLHD